MADANMDLRVLMFKNGVTQAELGGLLGMTQPEISVLLKRELGPKQKREIKDAIATATKSKRG